MIKRKVFKSLILASMIGSSFMLGKNISNKKVEIKEVLYKSTDTFCIDENEIGIEFTDGSWASVNQEKDEYTFQLMSMGDWSYEFDNLKDFENAIRTYLGEN